METDKLTFEEAYELSKTGNVFTTHTPVEAGFDSFAPELVGYYLGNYADDIGIGLENSLTAVSGSIILHRN